MNNNSNALSIYNYLSEIKEYVEERSFQHNNSHEPPMDNHRIVINVSGLIFETHLSTLLNFPNSLLGNSIKRKPFYNALKNEYFFDRNRSSFDAILYYYQSGGNLQRPVNVPIEVFLNEIEFYELGEEAIAEFLYNEGFHMKKLQALPKNSFQRKIWLLFNRPDSSILARFISMFSVFMVVLSVMMFCIETLPYFRQKLGNNTLFDSNKKLNKYRLVFFISESVCISWFTIEFLIRFSSSNDKREFLKSILNIIDLCVPLPYFFLLIFSFFRNTGIINESIAFSALKIIRLLLVIRVFKLSRYTFGIKVIGQTLKHSVAELELLLFFLFICVIIFSTAIYLAESDIDGTLYQSIPHSFWWAIITMTTVGYGDVYPVTILGKVVGTICSISGVILIALPIPVIVSNFEHFYHHNQDINKLNFYSKFRNSKDHISNDNKIIDSSLSHESNLSYLATSKPKPMFVKKSYSSNQM